MSRTDHWGIIYPELTTASCCGHHSFGMGLDCPNVHKVIHWGPSTDIELYCQETGRAGRDLLPAVAVLYVGGNGAVVRELDESINKQRDLP